MMGDFDLPEAVEDDFDIYDALGLNTPTDPTTAPHRLASPTLPDVMDAVSRCRSCASDACAHAVAEPLPPVPPLLTTS